MAIINMSSPWVLHYRMLNAFFAKDKGVIVVFDEVGNDVKVFVSDPAKAEALTKLLCKEKIFGNVHLKITVVPGNVEADHDKFGIEAALDGNDAVSRIVTFQTPLGNLTYVAFKAEVAQFYSDNLGDLNGYSSMLYQDIAKEIFKADARVFYCTDIKADVGKPLGEWP